VFGLCWLDHHTAYQFLNLDVKKKGSNPTLSAMESVASIGGIATQRPGHTRLIPTVQLPRRFAT
jgi:hypothetical protein